MLSLTMLLRQLHNNHTNFRYPYELLSLLVKLFALGIFSTEKGSKAWFELILVAGALCASGYLIWWQIPLLLLSIFLGTLAAGMFSVLCPQYLSENQSVQVDSQVSKTLSIISRFNAIQLENLSELELAARIKTIQKAIRILESHPEILKEASGFLSTLEVLETSRDFALAKSEYLREKSEALRIQSKLIEKERQRRTREDRIRKQQKVEEQQNKLEAIRKEEGFTGGCPPDNRDTEPTCPLGYPVKVTLHGTEDGYDGIIWSASHGKYLTIKPRWCYKSVEEALQEKRYRFREPKR